MKLEDIIRGQRGKIFRKNKVKEYTKHKKVEMMRIDSDNGYDTAIS